MSDLFEILEEENDDLRRRIKKLEEFVDHVATFKYIDAALGIQTLIDDAVDLMVSLREKPATDSNSSKT